MARNRVFRSVLLAAGVLLMAACASQPEGALLEMKFQRAAKHYEKFQHEGQTVYCQRTGTRSMPYTCLSESQLRGEVESFERWRNAVQPVRTPPGV